MASLRATAQKVLEEAREGIAWIALYREGRGWGAECFWPDFDPQSGSYSSFEAYDLAAIRDILAIDRNAIFVNGYDSNLGPIDGMTRETLASALRWQYENQFSRLEDVVPEAASAGPESAAPRGQDEEQQPEGREGHGWRLDQESSPKPPQYAVLGVRPRRPIARKRPGMPVEHRLGAGRGMGCGPPRHHLPGPCEPPHAGRELQRKELPTL